jgi:Rha family phage regulatory protein
MKELIPKDKYGVFADTKDTARVDSRFVAQFFEKHHRHVLRDIERITEPNSGLSKGFILLNFELSSYKDSTGRKLPCYMMTRDGFTMLVMGYTGKKAMKYKELYIRRFNEMEQFIKTLVTARKEFPLLTENIKLLHENPRPYHFSNECDMINRIVIGMSAKQFRQAHCLEKGTSIRPYLTDEQIRMIETLQKVDIGLLVSVPDYQQRKRYLEWYKMSHKGTGYGPNFVETQKQ